MINKPKYSICLIARDEEKTLPRLLDSLKEFKDRGGDINLLDTGSTDHTVRIAKKAGVKVKEAGLKYLVEVKNHTAINQKFVVRGEKKIVNKGDRYFNFSAARNDAAQMADNDFVFFYDADEVSVKMDIDRINELIEGGMTQAEYNFVFAYDGFGNEAIKFVQCKAYDRRLMNWTGRVHELVSPIVKHESKRIYLDETIYKLGHYQNTETGRHSYLTGLAVDCFESPNNDRHSHYLGRELFWNGRPKSALKEFKRHTKMKGWEAERAESYLFIGDIYGIIGQTGEQVKAYNEAFYIDNNRNTALIRLAFFYLSNRNYKAAVCYAKASLEINHTGFYADNVSNYREFPHEILYQSYGWLGNIPSAQEHIKKALEYQPLHPQYLRDTQYYFEYPDNGIEGWMEFAELQFLYESAQKYKKIVEIGSWKGRSTHALCTGNYKTFGGRGEVVCVDTWEGSDDLRDDTHYIAKREDVFLQFKNNISSVKKLPTIIRKPSIEAAKEFEDNSLDMVFIDAGHDYENVRDDIAAWLPKVKKTGIICGHDYVTSWMGVIQAVNEKFGRVDNLVRSIWSINLSNRENKIPKKIFTIWLGKEMPGTIKKCIDSQKIHGYDHKLITLDNCYKDCEYMQQALNSKHSDGVKYCKMSDYLRMHYLYAEGGIYLDADVEVLEGKNFDEQLSNEMFVGLEMADWKNGTVILGTAVLGAKVGHPFIKWWLNEVETKFRGDDNLNYQSSMDLLNRGGVNFQDKMRLYDPEYFYPYNSVTGVKNITDKTISIHHFMKTWTPDYLPNKFKDNIENGINFSFIKKGDGEIFCMNGMAGTNCDGHNYSDKLSKKLKESFDYLESLGAYVIDYGNQNDVNCLLHRSTNDLQKVKDFFVSIRNSERKKVYVAPRRLAIASYLLNAEHIEVPLVNAFDKYDEIKIIPEDDTIYMFSCGMPAKCLIADLLKQNQNITCIDVGSSFDGFIQNTRTFQATQEEMFELYKEYFPSISIIIPQLGRKEGLKKCIDSIKVLYYPQDRIEIKVIEGYETVPHKVAKGLKQSNGEYIVFAANDMAFEKDCLMEAIITSRQKNKALVSFNEGMLLPDKGNINTHFIIRKDFINEIGGEIFDLRFHHVGCDNDLWRKAEEKGQAIWCKDAKITHNHFSKNGNFDEVNKKGWSRLEQDRKLLKELSSKV